MKRVLRHHVSMIATAAAIAMPAMGHAQDRVADNTDNGGIREIVVTAEKRSVSAQDVPIAISAFDQQALDSKGITDVTALQTQVPSLKFNLPQGVVQITLRGAGNDTNTTGADNGVGFHYDGVYLGNPSASLADTWDVERIEILRGPQGTLYGRNTTGGAINIIPQKPTDRFEVKGDVTYGTKDLVRLRGAVNIPLTDNVAARFAGTFTDRGGYLKDITPNTTNKDDAHNFMVRGIVRADLTPNLKLELSGAYSKTDDDSISPVRVGPVYPSGGPANLISAAYAGALPKPASPRVTRKGMNELTRLEFKGGAALLEWDAGDFTIRSQSAYYKTDRQVNSDWDDSEVNFIGLYTRDRSKQFTQEVTLLSNPGGSLDWIVGAFYYDFKNKNNVFVDINGIDGSTPGPFFGTDVFQRIAANMDIKSFALYGQATYHIADSVRLTGGFRYSWDTKKSQSVLHPPIFPNFTVPPPGFNLSFPIDVSYAEPTGKIGLDVDLSPRNMVYASYSHGYKAGAINPSDPTPANQATKPEFADSFEIGSKNFFLDRALQFNISLFYADYTDVQINTYPTSNSVLINVPGGKAYGFDSDFIIQPVRDFRVNGSVGYIHSEYDDFVTGNPGLPPAGPGGALAQVNIGGDQLINTPPWTVSVGAEYTHRLPTIGSLTFRVDTSMRSAFYFDVFQNPDMRQESYTKTDLRITWRDESERFSLQGYVQNLENNDVKVTSLRPGGILGSTVPLAWYAPPRTWGVTFGFNF